MFRKAQFIRSVGETDHRKRTPLLSLEAGDNWSRTHKSRNLPGLEEKASRPSNIGLNVREICASQKRGQPKHSNCKSAPKDEQITLKLRLVLQWWYPTKLARRKYKNVATEVFSGTYRKIESIWMLAFNQWLGEPIRPHEKHWHLRILEAGTGKNYLIGPSWRSYCNLIHSRDHHALHILHHEWPQRDVACDVTPRTPQPLASLESIC